MKISAQKSTIIIMSSFLIFGLLQGRGNKIEKKDPERIVYSRLVSLPEGWNGPVIVEGYLAMLENDLRFVAYKSDILDFSSRHMYVSFNGDDKVLKKVVQGITEKYGPTGCRVQITGDYLAEWRGPRGAYWGEIHATEIRSFDPLKEPK